MLAYIKCRQFIESVRKIKNEQKAKLLKERGLEMREIDDVISVLRDEIVTTRSQLVDVLKALELACIETANSTEYCPDDLRKIKKCANTDGYCNDIEQEARCWKQYFLDKARSMK